MFEETLALMRSELLTLPNVASANIDHEDQSIRVVLTSGEGFILNPDSLQLKLNAVSGATQHARVVKAHIAAISSISVIDVTHAKSDIANVFPVIRASDFDVGGGISLTGNKAPLKTRFQPGLSVFYVFDGPRSVEYVNIEMLDDFGVARAELERTALANIARKAEAVQVEEANGVSTFKLDGFYETSLLLVPSFWNRHAPPGGRLIVGAPSRSLVIFGDADNPDVSRQVIDLTKKAFSQAVYAVSRTPFFLQDGQWSGKP